MNVFFDRFWKSILFVLLMFLTACTPSTAPATPVISSSIATPSNIATGNSSSLSWSVAGSNVILSLDQGIGVVTGTSRVVSPTNTTTYTLSAQNSAGTIT